MRFAYCTGMRRWPCSTKTTSARTTSETSIVRAKEKVPRLTKTLMNCAGIVAMIEVKIRSDMPLPTPRSVISSPSHMITAVPAVITITMTMMRSGL